MALILASASPRRQLLLKQMGLQFSVAPMDLDETVQPGERPADYVQRMAREKALAGYRAIAASSWDALVLGADTSVVSGQQILGKPADRIGARAMLEGLSGRTHQVMTAVALAGSHGVSVKLVVTDVAFRPLAQDEIDAYLETDEPWDKAGAYGIQGRGGIFVEHLAGSYSAVVGLPLRETAELLSEAGRPVWQCWEPTHE